MADQEAPAAAGKVSFNVSATVRYPVTATDGLAVAKARTAEARDAAGAERERIRAEAERLTTEIDERHSEVCAVITEAIRERTGGKWVVEWVQGVGLFVRTGNRDYNVDVREAF
jgi:hypothetical protein